MAHALGLPRLQLYVQFDRPLLPEELAAIRALIKRRQAGESVAYLVGKKEFWGLEFAVDARVLVPRPDTETLVEEALRAAGRSACRTFAPRRRRHGLGGHRAYARQAVFAGSRLRGRHLAGGAGGGAGQR